MAATRTPRSSWIEEGLRALAGGGPDAVRIEPLARALGVTKGGFYWHFDDRRALLDEMLDSWERVQIDEVIERVERDGGDARAKLRRLFAIASSGEPAAEGRPRGPRLGPARPGRRPPPAARRQPAHGLHALAVRCLLRGEDEVEARCTLAFSLFIGSPSWPPTTAPAAARRWWSSPWGARSLGPSAPRGG